jgi:hypothetical protein
MLIDRSQVVSNLLGDALGHLERPHAHNAGTALDGNRADPLTTSVLGGRVIRASD